jgi:hypothetical protein
MTHRKPPVHAPFSASEDMAACGHVPTAHAPSDGRHMCRPELPKLIDE